MYVVPLKTAVVLALRQTLASVYVPSDFRDTHVGIEFPMERQHYPGIWVDYDDSANLQIASIDHRELVYDDPNNPAAGTHEATRWTYGGEISLTVVALSSVERDNLYDQLVRIFAFSRIEDPVDVAAGTDFRSLVETNPYLTINVNWDELHPRGNSSAPGTPWETTNEVIYERTLGFDIWGEFVSDPTTNTLALLSAIKVTATNDYTGDAYALGIPRAG